MNKSKEPKINPKVLKVLKMAGFKMSKSKPITCSISFAQAIFMCDEMEKNKK